MVEVLQPLPGKDVDLIVTYHDDGSTSFDVIRRELSLTQADQDRIQSMIFDVMGMSCG